jgi:hypothetical protein
VHRLASTGGRYCLITPNKWLTAAYGRALRTRLAAEGSVGDLGRSPLLGDADACIVLGTVGGHLERRSGPPGSTPGPRSSWPATAPARASAQARQR